MSTIEKTRPQVQKEFDERKQDHGTRGNSYGDYGHKEYASYAKRKAQATVQPGDVYHMRDTDESVLSEESELDSLLKRVPDYANVSPDIMRYIEDMQRGEMDIDDVVSFYRSDLYQRGYALDYSDVETLLYELMSEDGHHYEDGAFDLNTIEDSREDEAYAINQSIDEGRKGDGIRRVRSRNLVRAVKRLTDDK